MRFDELSTDKKLEEFDRIELAIDTLESSWLARDFPTHNKTLIDLLVLAYDNYSESVYDIDQYKRRLELVAGPNDRRMMVISLLIKALDKQREELVNGNSV